MEQPWEFGLAIVRCQEASRRQSMSEVAVREAASTAALDEESYRIALAEAIVRHHSEGVAWSVAADVARGDKHVAKLRRVRDISVGVRDALGQAVWRAGADRKDAQRFADWSMRRELAEGGASGSWTDGELASPGYRT